MPPTMRVETGAFGGALQADGSVSQVHFARVVVPAAEFARLGLGDHEGSGAIPACFRWCHAAFGRGGARWAMRLPPGGDAAVLFAEAADAEAFLARWASSRRPRVVGGSAAQALGPAAWAAVEAE